MAGENYRQPIIGILAQETSKLMKDELEKKRKDFDSYIAASYVKAIESSGARVVPIFLNQPEEYYSNCLQSINGLLLPGGNTWFYKDDDITPKDDGYPHAAEILYNKVKEINQNLRKNGKLFPVLGICLGFEVLLFIDAGKREFRDKCETIKSALPINFKSELKNSELEECPVDLFREPVSYFSHMFYITEETMDKNHQLNEEWEVIATTTATKENHAIKYVSIIKSKNFPIIGLQFHPEKTPYEWKFEIPHDEKSVKASRYFFDWLVKQARKNDNQFENSQNLLQSLINNYNSKFTTKEKFSFDEIYFFPQNIDDKKSKVL